MLIMALQLAQRNVLPASFACQDVSVRGILGQLRQLEDAQDPIQGRQQIAQPLLGPCRGSGGPRDGVLKLVGFFLVAVNVVHCQVGKAIPGRLG